MSVSVVNSHSLNCLQRFHTFPCLTVVVRKPVRPNSYNLSISVMERLDEMRRVSCYSMPMERQIDGSMKLAPWEFGERVERKVVNYSTKEVKCELVQG